MATDAEIRAKGINFLSPQKYLQKPYEFPVEEEEEEETTPSGITNTNAFTNAFTNSGGNNYFAGSPNSLIQDYNTTTKDRYFRNQDTPLVDDLYQSKLDKTFMGMPSYRQQDFVGPFTPYGQPMNMDNPAASIENIIASRNMPLEQTMAGKVQDIYGRSKDLIGKGITAVSGFGPISYALGRLDRFDTLPATDQQFINMNMGYTGPTVFGKNTGNQDPFGINTRSAFGNYGEFVDQEADKTTEGIEESKKSWEGKYGDLNKVNNFGKTWAEMNKLRVQKNQFYVNQKNLKKEVEKAAQEEKDRVAGVQKDLDTGSYVDRDTSGMTASDRAVGGGAGVAGLGPSAEDRGSRSAQGYSQHAKGGRVGYFYGGLASIL